MIQFIFLLQNWFHASHRLVRIRLEDGRKVLKNLPIINVPEL